MLFDITKIIIFILFAKLFSIYFYTIFDCHVSDSRIIPF
nr:MAG TPA: hypothetical protein [Caudoviricetes sp.]